jgi:VWFA-related protein
MIEERIMKPLSAFALVAFTAAGMVTASGQQPQNDGQAFRFRTGVELINVTATVTDGSGRFVAGLRQDDFRIYEDDQPQPITHFNSERVPVSLGIVLDTSGSMDGEKMAAARAALERFLFEHLDDRDEVFLYRFDNAPELIEGWTMDREGLASKLRRIFPRGGTAMYDAVAEAVPLAQSGRHRKKALVLISDGNDTSSRTDPRALKQLIRESEVLVYAIGIDGQGSLTTYTRFNQGGIGGIIGGIVGPQRQRPRPPIPLPFPIPGRRPPTPTPTPRGLPPPQPRGGVLRGGTDDRVNVAALRDITDDSGGRTEIVRYPRDLGSATAFIADELSKQYYLGYPATRAKDGRWHAIRVEVRDSSYRVRARRGYVATP